MSISCQGTKNGILSLRPGVQARIHSRWKKLPVPLAVLSIAMNESGLEAMPEVTERSRSAGLWSGESFQKATSLRWASA